MDNITTNQANYANKISATNWDPVRVEYPVRKFPGIGDSSETIGRKWRDLPEVIMRQRTPIEELKEYFRDYNVTKQLTSSITTQDYQSKLPGTTRYNKNTSCTENEYIYPPSRKLADRTPQIRAHGTTEMKENYSKPITPPRLVTDKDQYKHPATLLLSPIPEPSWRDREFEYIDTTYDGFEKLLDPYLTTNRLHHRPMTAQQLNKPSCNRDIVTYYTFKNIPWTRTRKPDTEMTLPQSRPKSMYDRATFKQDVREIRTHNKLQWVPGTFRTESRDNYIPPILQPTSQIHNNEVEVSSFYEKSLGDLLAKRMEEQLTIDKKYSSENSVIGSRKPICSVVDQFSEKNKRLERLSVHKG